MRPTMSPRLRFAIGPVTALDNVSLFETIASGGQATTPSPAARSYYQESVSKSFNNPTFRSAWLENAWIPFQTAFDTPREFKGYQERMTVRHTDYGRTVLMLDAHDVPGSVQNNPNDPQNDLRLTRWRPGYRQAALRQNRDEFIPVTVDTLEIARIMQNTSPDSTEASEFVASQMTMAGNKDVVDELHTLFWAISDFAGQANVWHLQLPDLRPTASPTADEARQFAALIRAQVLNLENFTGAYTPAKNNVNVPKAQVRLAIRISTMQQLGTLAYATSFNPEFVFALPADQIVEIPDEYFDRNPYLADQVAFLHDAGTDKKWGTLVLDDTFYGLGVDVFQAKTSENRVLHHASIIGVNPFRTFIIAGIGDGSQETYMAFTPTTVVGTVYGPPEVGVIEDGGDLVRGQQYSTKASVTDASGYPAGGWIVTATGLNSPESGIQIYNNLYIAPNETATSVTVVFTSIVDPTKTDSETFDITGTAFEPDGSGIIVMTNPTITFAAGSGSGGALTYSGVPTGVSLYGSTTGLAGAYTPLGASPVAVAHGTPLYVQERASSGYVFPDGTQVRQHGPYTAA